MAGLATTCHDRLYMSDRSAILHGYRTLLAILRRDQRDYATAFVLLSAPGSPNP